MAYNDDMRELFPRLKDISLLFPKKIDNANNNRNTPGR